MKRHIKPARSDLLVRCPDGTHLQVKGEVLPVCAWWRRRERDGDVIISAVVKKSSLPEKDTKSRSAVKDKS